MGYLGILFVTATVLLVNISSTLAVRQPCPPESSYNIYTDDGSCLCDDWKHVMNPNGTKCVFPVAQGETCSESEDVCDPSIKDLTCKSGICQCRDSKGWDPEKAICYGDKVCGGTDCREGATFYDPAVSLTKCVVLIGMTFDSSSTGGPLLTCPLNASPVLVPVTQPDRDFRTEYVYWYGGNEESICKCDANFTMRQDDPRSCVPIKFRGEACDPDTKDHRCDIKSNLACVNKICDCIEDKLWDEVRGTCLVKAEQNCIHDGFAHNCVPGADCEINLFSKQFGTCACAGKFAAENGFCFKKYGIECSGKNECKPPYVCMDGSCACPNPVMQRYDSELDTCRGLVGSTCSKNSICTTGAECNQGFCTCSAGFRESSDGSCVIAKTYDEPCSAGECDAYQGLLCVEGSCTCINPALSFVNGLGCLAPVGSICGNIKPFDDCDEGRCEYLIRCEDDAECELSCFSSGCLSQDEDVSIRRCALPLSFA